MIFHKLGLDWQTSKNTNMVPQKNNDSSQSQPYNSLIRSDIQNNSNIYNNSQFKNQFDYSKQNGSSSLRNSYDNRNSNNNIAFNVGNNNSTLAQAGMSLLGGKQNNIIGYQNDQSVMGQRYNESIINGENNTIVAERYGKTITQGDLNKLRSGNILSEDALNFFLKYLEERQGHQFYIYKLNQKEYPKGMRMLYLSSGFYKHYTKGNPLQQENLDFKSVRYYMKPYTGDNNSIFERFDKLFIPILLTLNEMHLVVIDLGKQELTLYITSTFQGYPREPINNPILQNLMRFLQKELYEKKMKNLNFINWKHNYISLEEAYIQKYKQSILNTAFIINQITKQRVYSTISVQDFLSFNQRLLRLFSQIGITQNKRNEIVIENMSL